MNTISVTYKGIILFINDPDDWYMAEHLCGSAENLGMGQFRYTTSALNLQRVFCTFRGDKKPRVIGPRWLLDKKSEELTAYIKDTNEAVRICGLESYPVEPNGKFVPYSHQTRIVGVLQNGTKQGVFSDCGTGKTGSLARAVELEIERGSVTRGKILVSAPLSILETSWLDDIKKFTNLKAGLLWLDITNKDILGEEQVIFDYGPKPADTVTTRTSERTLHRNPEGRVVAKVTTLDKPAGPWERFKAKVKIAINVDGVKTPFGPVIGRTAVKEETKKIELKRLLADPTYDLFLINHDGVRIYEDELKENEFAWVVVDESTKIKSPSSQVYKSHVEISWGSRRRNVLTGTPNPNGFIDLWAQFYFLDRGLTLEGSMKDYLKEYFSPVKIGHFNGKDAIKYVLRSENDKKRLVARVRRAGIFLKQRDCIDLPPRTDMRRVVRLTGEQERAYIEMEEELATTFSDHSTKVDIRAEAVNALAKMMKLRQITSGYLPSSDGDRVIGKFESNPKIDDLSDFIDELGDLKLCVVCQFTEEIQTVLEKFKDLGIASIDGGVSVRDRNESIRDFQTTDDLQLMVLQPAAAAHGITLTKSSHMFYLSLGPNFEQYYQTAKRIERIGQKNNIFVIHSLAELSDGSPTIDQDLFDLLADKSRDRDALFNESRDLGGAASMLAERMIKRAQNRV